MPGVAGFCECVEASDDLPLRQGDVLEAVSHPVEPELRWAIVVTADCDIAQLKHNNTISYVPLLPLDFYLSAFFVPKRVEKGIHQLRRELAHQASEFLRLRNAGASDLSEQALEIWAKDTTAVEIAQALQIEPGRKHDGFVALMKLLQRGLTAVGTTELRKGLEFLSGLKQHNKVPADKAVHQVHQDIEGYLKSLPGDAFFIANVDPQRETGDGFVAYLRILRELRPIQVALKPADLRSGDVTMKRIARLTSPYVYRMTQQLASVFASIGLPTAYEVERDRITTNLRPREEV